MEGVLPHSDNLHTLRGTINSYKKEYDISYSSSKLILVLPTGMPAFSLRLLLLVGTQFSEFGIEDLNAKLSTR